MGEENRISFMNIYQQMKSGGSLSDIAKDHFGEDLVKCQGGEWSQWFDADDPSGLGDQEPLGLFKGREGMCDKPTDIDARTVDDEKHYIHSGNFVQLSPDRGLYCYNHFQAKFGKEFCKDFEVRFCCPTAKKFEDEKCDGYRSEWITIDGPGGVGDLELVESVMSLAPDLLFCQPISQNVRVLGKLIEPLHFFNIPRFGSIGYSNEDITVRYCCKQSTRKDLVLVTGASKTMIKDNESIINWLLFNHEEVQEYTTFWVGIYDNFSFQKYTNVDEVIGALRTINALIDYPPSCTADIFKLMSAIMEESNFQAKIFGFLDRNVDMEGFFSIDSYLAQTESTMKLFQTGRSDPFCGQNHSNQCYGPPPSEEQKIEQWEAMQNDHLLVSVDAEYWYKQLIQFVGKICSSQAMEDIEPLEEIQQFVIMISKPDLLSHLLQTPII